jgi:putative membrane protein
MKTLILVTTLAAVAIAGPAIAQSVGERTGVNAALGVAPKTEDFVKQVAISDMFEIETSKLAQQKAAAGPVRSFASQMEKDHTKTSTELKGLVSGGKVKVQLPTALDDSHKSKLDKLKGLSGADFDKAVRVGSAISAQGCRGSFRALREGW